MAPGFAQFRKQVSNPMLFRLFLLQRLPSAFFAGLRIREMNEEQASVSVRYRWFTQNPFRSMYFAVQAMAAEMSTGLLASGHIHKRRPAVSMLVTGLEATFLKRVTGTVVFTCNDGAAIGRIVEECIATGEARTIACRSTGKNESGETVSEFSITWSFKARASA